MQLKWPISIALFACAAPAALASNSLNHFGVPGLIDMPSAQSLPDGALAFSISHAGASTRSNMSFQITPRLLGSFRYTKIQDYDLATVGESRFDRSFDLQFRLVDEGKYRPSVVIGLQDFIGSGIYSSEYIVATKHIGKNLRVTGGLGWGRLGSYNGLSNPLGGLSDTFKTRPVDYNAALGDQVQSGRWFRGDVAPFAGIEWQTPWERLRLKVEYSSDAYIAETTRGLIERKSPINFGAEMRVGDRSTLGLYYKHGSELGLALSTVINPNVPLNTVKSTPPLPVLSALDAPQQQTIAGMIDELQALLGADGMEVEGLRIDGDVAELRLRNNQFDLPAQALGRAARALSNVAPPSVSRFIITPVENGLTVTALQIDRADLENNAVSIDNVGEAARGGSFERPAKAYPRVEASLRPYAQVHLFDPDDPVRGDIGLRARGRLEFGPGLSVSGSAVKRVLGNIDNNTRASDSTLPRVRSDVNLYQAQSDPTLERLTADYQFQLSPSVYGRFSAGYLERMYGGVSAELLWKPYDSRWAVGAEVNYVKQRDFDGLLGFQDYSIATGHASLYLDVGRGYEAQVDAGRYLAGDWGGTLSLNRTFKNGWKVGAYMTLTDVSFDEFGEGRFDKGIRLRVPLSWAKGQPDRTQYDVLIQPVYRDGGARLNVANRLYDQVRQNDKRRVLLNWDKFWK